MSTSANILGALLFLVAVTGHVRASGGIPYLQSYVLALSPWACNENLYPEAIHGITEFSMVDLKTDAFHIHRLKVEVAIHTILYVRQVYPADLFVRRKKYDTPVFQSRHPALNEYIASAVKAVGDELALVRLLVIEGPPCRQIA
jgi:hypothetical protein